MRSIVVQTFPTEAKARLAASGKAYPSYFGRYKYWVVRKPAVGRQIHPTYLCNDGRWRKLASVHFPKEPRS